MKKWLMTAARAPVRHSEENFERNKKAFAGHRGLVHGQKTKPACDMVYGTMPMSWNGCELIAAANVMTMLGKELSLPEVVHEFELNRMHYIFPSGYWGTAPRAMKRFFDAHGLRYSSHSAPADLEKAAVTGACGIVSFWNNRRKGKIMLNFFSGGLHTVAFRCEGGRYFVYNLHSYDTRPFVTGDLRDIYEGRRFIVGYVFPREQDI